VNSTVFVIDDDAAVRDSLVFLLRAEGLTSRGFASARAFLDQFSLALQGCIVTDVRMPEMDGMALIGVLRDRGCALPIIVITGHADVPLAIQAMKAGVADFIEKPFESEVILRAIRSALDTAAEQSVTIDRRMTLGRRRDSLTERERQVLGLLVQGRSNKEAALQLGISFRTVEIHRANVMAKMQADSLSELVRMSLTLDAA